MTCTVDTNVPVTANGGPDVHVSEDCQTVATEFLIALVSNEALISLDLPGHILAEYAKRLKGNGQPGVGDRFYRFVIDNQHNPKIVRYADPNHGRGAALRKGFADGTLTRFDDDDRGFAFCSAIHRVPVVTISDSDWTKHETGLRACSVRIRYLCGKAAATSSRDKTKASKKKKARKSKKLGLG